MEFILRFTFTNPDLDTTIVGTINPAHLQTNLDILDQGPLPPDLYKERTVWRLQARRHERVRGDQRSRLYRLRRPPARSAVFASRTGHGLMVSPALASGWRYALIR